MSCVMAIDDANTAHARGMVAGKIDERLDSHDKHFAMINGSLGKINTELHAIQLEMQAMNAKVDSNHQRLTDKLNSDAATRDATAEALAHDMAHRRAQSDRRFAPWQKVFAVVMVAIAVGMFTLTLVQFLRL